MASETTGWSEDGQWFWDGSQWNEAISPDGQYIYDGTAWAPFTGSRSPMPIPFAAPPPPPATPKAPTEGPLAAQAEYPAWMDATEVARLKEEKSTRRAQARQAPDRSQPIDWDEMHERSRSGGPSRLEKMSGFLLLMVLFGTLLIVLAIYALFIYLPAHPLTHAR